jgi:hypothetical protein
MLALPRATVGTKVTDAYKCRNSERRKRVEVLLYVFVSTQAHV